MKTLFNVRTKKMVINSKPDYTLKDGNLAIPKYGIYSEDVEKVDVSDKLVIHVKKKGTVGVGRHLLRFVSQGDMRIPLIVISKRCHIYSPLWSGKKSFYRLIDIHRDTRRLDVTDGDRRLANDILKKDIDFKDNKDFLLAYKLVAVQRKKEDMPVSTKSNEVVLDLYPISFICGNVRLSINHNRIYSRNIKQLIETFESLNKSDKITLEGSGWTLSGHLATIEPVSNYYALKIRQTVLRDGKVLPIVSSTNEGVKYLLQNIDLHEGKMKEELDTTLLDYEKNVVDLTKDLFKELRG
jgi:hypothetical protein